MKLQQEGPFIQQKHNMIKTNIKNDFLIFVLEEFKFFEKKSIKEIIEVFSKYNIFEYIINHYDVLHTMGGRAIVDDINMLIESRCL